MNYPGVEGVFSVAAGSPSYLQNSLKPKTETLDILKCSRGSENSWMRPPTMGERSSRRRVRRLGSIGFRVMGIAVWGLGFRD